MEGMPGTNQSLQTTYSFLVGWLDGYGYHGDDGLKFHGGLRGQGIGNALQVRLVTYSSLRTNIHKRGCGGIGYVSQCVI
jgi:hypothetical protein